MSTIWDFIRSEPVALGTIVTIAATLVLTLTNNDPRAAAIVSAVEAIIGVLVRQAVTPTVKLQPTPVVVPHG